MPIYEYECSSCGDQFEAIQSFSDKPLKKCEKCGGRLHKLVSECAFHLKGTGWYVTDYGNKTSGSGNGSKKPAKDDKDSSKDTSSENTSGKDTGSKDTSSKDTSSKDPGKNPGKNDASGKSGSDKKSSTSSKSTRQS